VRAEWKPVKGLAIEATLVAVGSVPDSSVPTGDVLLPDWRRLNLAGRYEVHRGVALTVGVENLLNTRYEEAIGVRSPGVRFRGGLEARF
jgi:outer membrane receptor protein involved in Fe transport